MVPAFWAYDSVAPGSTHLLRFPIQHPKASPWVNSHPEHKPGKGIPGELYSPGRGPQPRLA